MKTCLFIIPPAISIISWMFVIAFVLMDIPVPHWIVYLAVGSTILYAVLWMFLGGKRDDIE